MASLGISPRAVCVPTLRPLQLVPALDLRVGRFRHKYGSLVTDIGAGVKGV